VSHKGTFLFLQVMGMWTEDKHMLHLALPHERLAAT
jgi:hypothetical protein